MLLHDFSQEYHNFDVLKKKKKKCMPGLQVTIPKIREYLTGLTNHML